MLLDDADVEEAAQLQAAHERENTHELGIGDGGAVRGHAFAA